MYVTCAFDALVVVVTIGAVVVMSPGWLAMTVGKEAGPQEKSTIMETSAGATVVVIIVVGVDIVVVVDAVVVGVPTSVEGVVVVVVVVGVAAVVRSIHVLTSLIHAAPLATVSDPDASLLRKSLTICLRSWERKQTASNFEEMRRLSLPAGL